MATKLASRILAPADIVFDYVRNLDKVQLWVKEVEEAWYTHEPADRAEGTTFVQKIRQGLSLNTYQGEVLGFEQDRWLQVRLTGEALIMHVDYRVRPEERGCHFTFVTEVSSRNLRGAFLGMMFQGFSEQVLRRQLMTLKRVAEAEHRRA
ncbi:MAG: SRPBCC family protein [Bacteroidota bacterium]